MIIAINDELLYKIIDFATNQGRKMERRDQGKEAKFITQNKAYKLYGSGNVKKWVNAGIVTRFKDADNKIGSGVRYQVSELDAAAFKFNYIEELSPSSKQEIKDLK